MPDNKLLIDKFPFLTLFEFGGEELLGIVQNANKNVVSVYVLNHIASQEEKRMLIEAGKKWWEQSNRRIPINLFLKEDFGDFSNYLNTYSRKEFTHIQGPIFGIQDLNNKRIKRKKVELIIVEK